MSYDICNSAPSLYTVRKTSGDFTAATKKYLCTLSFLKEIMIVILIKGKGKRNQILSNCRF
jgi:hypothetical protein